MKETNELQAVTRVTDGPIDQPSSSQGGVIERLEHAVERPGVPRQRNFRSGERVDRGPVEEIEDRAAASYRPCDDSEPRFSSPFSLSAGDAAAAAILLAGEPTGFTTTRPHGSIRSTDYRHHFLIDYSLRSRRIE